MANCTFYKMNSIDSTTTFSLTTAATSGAWALYDENDSTKLNSNASSDTVSEVWTMTFPGNASISAIHIGNHNWKDFTIQYWSSTAFQDFSTTIATTTNSGTYHYFNDFHVTSSKVQFTINKTIVADEQKSAGQIRVLNKIGEMSVNPQKANIKYHENSKSYYTDSKENVFVLFGVSTKYDLEWKNLPATDITTLESCKYLGEPFYVYLSGGADYERRGWRIEDIVLVNYTNAFDPNISDNLLANGEDIKVTLEGVKTRST